MWLPSNRHSNAYIPGLTLLSDFHLRLVLRCGTLWERPSWLTEISTLCSHVQPSLWPAEEASHICWQTLPWRLGTRRTGSCGATASRQTQATRFCCLLSLL